MTSNSANTLQPDFEILAVVCNGPAPLSRRLEVPLRSGLTALYGRNGAGKTRLLKAIRAAVSGEQHDAQVIVRPLDDASLAEKITASHEEWLGEAERIDLEERLGQLPWRHNGRSLTDAVLGDVIIETWMRTSGWSGLGSDREDRPSPVEVVDEVLQNMRLALNRRQEGNWDLAVTICLNEQTPLLSGLQQRIIHEWFDAFPGEPEFSDSETGEVLESAERAADQYSGRLCRRDFFTVLGPLSDPIPSPDMFDDDIGVFSEPGSVITLVSVCEGVANGALCDLRTDEELCSIREFSKVTLDAIKSWGQHEHAARLEQEGADDGSVLAAQLWGATGLPMIDPGESGAQVAAWVAEPVEELVESMNTVLTSMLPEAPTLRCEIVAPEQWAAGEPCRWSAVDPTGAKVDMDQLSGAQTYLVRVAFTLALYRFHRRFELQRVYPRIAEANPALLLLDEPEAGLHRLAEDTLTVALDDYGRRNDIAVIAATHSSAFLRNPRIALIEVFRKQNGSTYVRDVEFPDEAGIDALGISRAELLQLYQLVLLVEGHHEQLIFGEMFGKELGRRRAHTVPLRGTFNLNAVVDLQILAHTLEQPVLAVLDNANAESVDHLWAELKGLPGGTTLQDARPVFERCLGPAKKRTDEENQIASLAKNLLKANQLDRFEVYGLSRGDIIEYLPVERLVPDATSWNELRKEHTKLRQNDPKRTPKDFKHWLRDMHQADFGDDAILLAAAIAAETPSDEFLGLLARVDSILDGWTR